MREYPGIDLLDLWRGTLTPRRVMALIRGLPRDCALHRAIRGEAATWGPGEHLQAAAVDALRAGNWQRGGDERAPRPDPVPRPRDLSPRVPRIDPRKLHAARQRLAERRRKIAAGEIQ